jgi:phospholipase C
VRRLDPAVQAIADLPHDHAAISHHIATPPADPTLGGMGGFVDSYAATRPAPADPGLAMGYYDEQGAPIFDFLARNYAVCDRWFAALPCGTQPNRLMAMSGTSAILDNAGGLLPDQPLAYDWLTDRGIRWCAYQSGGFFPFFSLMAKWLPEIVTSLTGSSLAGLRGRFRRYSRFASEWAGADAMPSVIFIEPEYSDGPHEIPNDDHPPTGIAKGQAFLADIYQTLISNPARWATTMMVVTYDEHGGFFDHVAPLAMPPMVLQGVRIDTTGVRVPALVVSPQVAPGTVFSGGLDHTSILQLLADRFDPQGLYSPDVSARQRLLDRLLNVLQPPGAVRAPPIPVATLQAVRAAAAQAAAPPPIGASPTDPSNAQALHQVALKARADHPDQLAGPGWEAVNSYLQAVGVAAGG